MSGQEVGRGTPGYGATVDAARRVRAWVAGVPPVVFDVVVALFVIAWQFGFVAFGYVQFQQELGLALGEPTPLGLAVSVVGGAALALRRRAPLLTVAVTGAATLTYLALGLLIPPMALIIAAYTAGRLGARPASLWVVGATLLLALPVLAFVGLLQASNTLVAIGAAYILGDRQRTRRNYLAGLEDRAARLEREREDRDRLAVAAERARIARELHDVVAHSVSVMVVQAGAARHNLTRDPARASEAIAEVEATGRRSLAEMRRLLGVLRVEGGEVALSPQPGLDDLEELVAHFADAGLPVRLQREGDGLPHALPPGVNLSLYRILQEALTNALKHAAASRVLVRLRCTIDEVTVSVEDDGRGAEAGVMAAAGGHGLVGMRERAALLGGHLALGPRPEGGFSVVLTLPLEPAPRPPSEVGPPTG